MIKSLHLVHLRIFAHMAVYWHMFNFLYRYKLGSYADRIYISWQYFEASVDSLGVILYFVTIHTIG